MRNRPALAIVVAGHLAVAGLLSATMATLPRAPASAAMTLVEIEAPRPKAATAPPPTDTSVSTDVAAPSFDVAQPAAVSLAAGVAGCDLTDRVAAGLRSSAAVHEALDAIPRQSRSVANAIMIWNGTWSDAAGVGGSDRRNVIREAVVASIRDAPAECREATVSGPRLIFVPGTAGTAILAVGSGAWRWGELLETSRTGVAA